MPLQLLVVEFAGLPGAGKTTLAQNVIMELESTGYKCFTRESFIKSNPQIQNRTNKLFNYAPYAFKQRGIFYASLLFAWHIKPVNLTSIRRAFYLFFMRRHLDQITHSAKQSGHHLIILDQGLLQSIWSAVLTGEPPPDKYLLRLLKGLYDCGLPRLIISVDVDIDTVLMRIKQRPGIQSRFDQMSSGEAELALNKHQDYLNKIITFAGHYPGVRVCNVNGHRNIEENIKSITYSIEQALTSALGTKA